MISNTSKKECTHRLCIFFFYLPFSGCNVLGKYRKLQRNKKHSKSFTIVKIVSGILPFRYIHLKIKFRSYFIKFYILPFPKY